MEQLPRPIALEREVSKSAVEKLTERMNTCSQLVSFVDYQAYCKSKVCFSYSYCGTHATILALCLIVVRSWSVLWLISTSAGKFIKMLHGVFTKFKFMHID